MLATSQLLTRWQPRRRERASRGHVTHGNDRWNGVLVTARRPEHRVESHAEVSAENTKYHVYRLF